MGDIKLFFRYFKELKSYLWLLAAGFISDIVLSLLVMLPPLFFIVIFDYAYPNKDLLLLSCFLFVCDRFSFAFPRTGIGLGSLTS